MGLVGRMFVKRVAHRVSNLCWVRSYASLYRDVPSISSERFDLSTEFGKDMPTASENLLKQLQAYDKPRDLSNLLKVVKNGKYVLPEHLCYAMEKLSASLDIEEIKSLIDLWKYKQFAASSAPYNYLLDSYLHMQDREKGTYQALELFKDLKKQGVEISKTSYECMINGLITNNEISSAFELLQEMRAKELKPSQQSYFLMLTSLTQSVQLDRAGEVFTLLKQDYGEPDLASYRLLLVGYAHSGETEKIKEILENQKSKDPSLWAILIDAYAQSGADITAITALKEQIAKQGSLENSEILSALLNYYAKNADVENATATLAHIKNSNFSVAPYAYKSLLRHYTEKGDIKRALALFQEMEDNKVFDQEGCHIIGNGLAQIGDLEVWAKIVTEMADRGLALDRTCYHITIQCLLCRNDVKQARDMIDMMHNERIYPDASTYLLFVRHHCALGEMQEAAAVMDEISRVGLDPNSETYISMMLGYVQKGDMKSAAPLIKYLSSGDRIELLSKE